MVTYKPQVSVIINFLNLERFIREAIDSVFAQTYESWELLLVDDGSADGSTNIALEYAKQYPDVVHYLEHEGHRNRGASAARNLGVRNAQGLYIAFLDADDVWFPQKLEQQVAILNEHPEAAMVYGLSQWWYSWTGKSEDCLRDFTHELGVSPNSVIYPPALLPAFFLRQEAAIPTPTNILVRREAIERVGGFDETFRLYTDQNLYAKICLRNPVFAANTCWDRYRQHPDSSVAIADKKGQAYSTRLYFLNWLEHYLSDQGLNDPQILRALQQEIRRCRHPNLQRSWMISREYIYRLKGRWKPILRRLLTIPFLSSLGRIAEKKKLHPRMARVRFGNLRRTTPFDRDFGFERGLPIDRYYIEQFLSAYSHEIQGCVLEILDDSYTRRFGEEGVFQADVLSMESSPKTTLLGDLTRADHISSNSYDCIILTQTLHLIYDVRAVLTTIYRILKPGGILLLTVPGISQISRYDMDRWGDYWRFTTRSIRRLLEEYFPTTAVEVISYGNVLAATAFLYGLAANELDSDELDAHDPDYEALIAVRAVKSQNALKI